MVEDFDWTKGLYYTDYEIPSAFQHTRDNRLGFWWSSHNFSANRSEPVGNNNEFPWKNPGGTVEGMVYTWKILQVPSKIEFKWTNEFVTINTMRPGFEPTGYKSWGIDMVYPNGTKVFEVFSFKEELLVFEIRMREKVDGHWKTRRFAPFKKGDLQIIESKEQTLKDPIHKTVLAFHENATVDYVGPVENRRELIKNATWQETKWVPTTNSQNSVVPAGYMGAFTTKNCMNCHQHAGQHVSKFDFGRDWYGHVRGSLTDKILSFHPIHKSTLGSGNYIEPRLDRRLESIIDNKAGFRWQ